MKVFKTLIFAVLVATLTTACAPRVILAEDTPGARITEGVAVAFTEKVKKVGLGADSVENAGLAFSSTTAGSVATLAFALFNRLDSGPYLELHFRPDDGSPDQFIPFRINSPIKGQPGDRIKIIQLGEDLTAYNPDQTERYRLQFLSAVKK